MERWQKHWRNFRSNVPKRFSVCFWQWKRLLQICKTYNRYELFASNANRGHILSTWRSLPKWDDYILTGTARSSLTQKSPSSNKLSKIHDGITYGGYSLGSYSHTLDGVSYYTNGDIDGCRRPRESKIRWKCGNRHMQIVSGWEPAICQYEFVIEINCCQDEQNDLAGMSYNFNFLDDFLTWNYIHIFTLFF